MGLLRKKSIKGSKSANSSNPFPRPPFFSSKDLIRTSIARYKDRSSEWRVAAERYQRGELIPNELAQQLVKAEMGRQPYAKAYFIEGFPREARQVEDFERNVSEIIKKQLAD